MTPFIDRFIEITVDAVMIMLLFWAAAQASIANASTPLTESKRTKECVRCLIGFADCMTFADNEGYDLAIQYRRKQCAYNLGVCSGQNQCDLKDVTSGVSR